MTLVMAYVILIAAGVGACAFVTETVARSRGKAGRWVWTVALALTALATLLAMIVPRPAVERGADSLLQLATVSTATESTVRPTAQNQIVTVGVVFGIADMVLPVAWFVSTAGLVIAIGFGRRRLRRERIRAQRTELAGHGVLVTEDVGPAVAGIREPVVFVPRWVLALDDPSQRLLMAHEMEHVHRRDTAVLFGGAVSAALMPWNPVVWWMVGRLRLAVEQDCDARVLAAHPGVRRYADLLLTAASRHALASRLLAAHFGEHTSDLLRRIEAMTNKDKLPWRKLVMGGLASAALIAAACETPRPDPVAPIELARETVGSTGNVVPDDTTGETLFKEVTKSSVVVFSSDGRELASYAGEIPVKHLPPDGVQSIKAEERPCGSDKCFAVRITLKPGESLNTTSLPSKMRASVVFDSSRGFSVAEIELKNDKSMMLMKDATLTPESDVLPGKVKLAGSAEEVPLTRFEERERAKTSTNVVIPDAERSRESMRVLMRGSQSHEIPNILLLSADGSELGRFLANDARTTASLYLDAIKVDDVGAIEVYKGNSCPAAANIPCPLIKISLKAGREGGYRKR